MGGVREDHDHQILGPTDFSNQWLEIWLGLVLGVKLPHVPEVLGRKSVSTGKLSFQIAGQVLDHRFPPAERIFSSAMLRSGRLDRASYRLPEQSPTGPVGYSRKYPKIHPTQLRTMAIMTPQGLSSKTQKPRFFRGLPCWRVLVKTLANTLGGT